MINFIICDDNKKLLENEINVINNFMMNNKLSYEIYSYLDYNDDFFNKVDEKIPNKIYILDVEVPSKSGIDVARIIRKNDVDSIIIFLTSHNEVGSILIKEELMFLTFICKYDDAEERLKSAIKKSLDMVGTKIAIRFEDHGSIYTLPVKNIIYMYTETVERKIVIKTDFATFKISKSLTEIEKLLPSQFKHSHRACIVNVNRISVIDKRKNRIIFDNDESTELLSKSYKKELM